MEPGELVQVDRRVGVVLAREPKRVRVRFEDDGAVLHVSARHTAQPRCATAAEIEDERLWVGAGVEALTGDAGVASSTAEAWAPAVLRDVRLVDAADGEAAGGDTSAAGARLSALRFRVEFAGGAEAWRRVHEVRPAASAPSGAPKLSGAGRASRSKQRAPSPSPQAAAVGANAKGRVAPAAVAERGAKRPATARSKRKADAAAPPAAGEPPPPRAEGAEDTGAAAGASGTAAVDARGRGKRAGGAAALRTLTTEQMATPSAAPGAGGGSKRKATAPPTPPAEPAAEAVGAASAGARRGIRLPARPKGAARGRAGAAGRALPAAADSDSSSEGEPGAEPGAAPADAEPADAGARPAPRQFRIGGQAALPGEGGAAGAVGAGAAGAQQQQPAPPAPRQFRIGGQAALPGEGGADAADAGPARGGGAAWCGPWSTARELLSKRRAAAAERAQALEEAGSGAAGPPHSGQQEQAWTPARSKRARAGSPAAPGAPAAPARPLPSLRQLAVELVAMHIDAVPSFGELPAAVLRPLQAELARRRALTPAAVQLFAEAGGQCGELALDDCCLLTEEELLPALRLLGEGRAPLKVLCLGSAGRAFTATVARALCGGSGGIGGGGGSGSSPTEAAVPCGALEHLSLGGCYKLPAASLVELLGSPLGARLRTLQLTYAPQLGRTVTAAIARACGARLESLALDYCDGVDDGALAELEGCVGLRELSLSGLPRASAQALVQLLDRLGGGGADGCCPLELLALADNEQLTAEAVCALAALSLGRVRSLDLSGVTKLDDAALLAVTEAAPCLRRLLLRGCAALSDSSVLALCAARGAGLVELSLNGCSALTDAAARALEQHCARSLIRLDLSWCRRVSEDALGRLADACAAGAMGAAAEQRARSHEGEDAPEPALCVWGLTQLSERFYDGHSLPPAVLVGAADCRQLQAGRAPPALGLGGTHWSVRVRATTSATAA